MAKKKFASRIEAEKPTEAELVQQQFSRWLKDIPAFFDEALGVRLTNQQTECAHIVRDMVVAKLMQSGGRRLGTKKKKYWKAEYSQKQLAEAIGISIHSGKGTGKDFFIAGLSIYFNLLFEDFKGLATAPSFPQLEDVYSSEVKKLLRDSKAELWRYVEVTRSRVREKIDGKASENFITKRTAVVKGNSEEQAATLRGIHAPYMVFFVDEADGLPDGCFKALEETLTGKCNFAILITNMTRNTGYSYRTHYDAKEREHWVTLRWNSEESDLDDITGHKGLSTQVARMERKYGRDSNPYRIAVLGLPPQQEDDALFRLEWLQAARDRWEDMEVDPDNDPIFMGVDVGRGGDDSAIAQRISGKVMWVKAKSTPDTRVLADWADLEIEAVGPDSTVIDSGGMGKTFCDFFRNLRTDFLELDVSGGASSSSQFFRLRDELWWRVREEFEKGRIAIPPDDEQLFHELLSLKVEQWEHPLKIISKKKLKALGLASPNKADAVMHTYHFRSHTAAYAKQARDKYRERTPIGGSRNANTSWMVG